MRARGFPVSSPPHQSRVKLMALWALRKYRENPAGFFPLFLTLILQCRVHRKAAELAATLKVQYVRFDLSFISIKVKKNTAH